MHIKSFGFRGLRKLGLNHDLDDHNFQIDKIEQSQASTINIVVGPNGGGKSTVVDLVRAMGDATVIPTLVRENITTATSSGFVATFDGDSTVTALSNAISMEEFGLAIASLTPAGNRMFRGKIKKNGAAPLPAELSEVIDFLSVKVGYRSRHDEVDIPTQAFIDALNANGKYLSGLAPFSLAQGQEVYETLSGSRSKRDLAYPISLIDNGVVSVSFNDDERQHNHVPIAMFPSGWRAFGGLVAWLTIQDSGSICVIEEPETHIHPKLLRVLIQRISDLAERRELQIFMTTHSSTLIDIYAWPNQNIKLFEADGHRIRELTKPSLALANLGVRPSDVCQANGVIWVEGSSDRLYLIHWLKLWCAKKGKNMPVENIHFAFLLYGGAMLNQFSVGSGTDLIEIFRINANSIVIMDRDLDFVTDATGQEIPDNPLGAKAKIYADIGSAGSGRYCWITQQYTIESYLPSGFRDKYYVLEDGRLKATTTLSKVTVAEKCRSQFNDFTASYETGSDLPVQIQRLYEAIDAWNV